MVVTRRFILVFLLCFVSGCLSKPTENKSDLTTGRGIVSTLWDWLTYPFTWWRSEPELPPVSETLKITPHENYEITRHNVTIFCNDQTCTTVKCGYLGCRNITCSLYDTDFTGECREHDLMPLLEANHVDGKVLEQIKNNISQWAPVPLETTSDMPDTTTQRYSTPVEERPLELEAILSSTVKEKQKAAENNETVLEPAQTVPSTPRIQAEG